MVIAVGAISRVAAVVLAAASVSQLPGRCSQYGEWRRSGEHDQARCRSLIEDVSTDMLHPRSIFGNASTALVNARGTGEAQGESSGFVVMNAFVTGNMTGGQIYNVDYPANVDQDSSAATAEIIRNVRLIADGSSNTTLPPCVILQGYSQGASAVVDALQQLTDEAAMNVVRGVILLGDPRHKPGLLSNIDNDGLTSTRASPGAGNLLNLASLPDPYVDRTIDVCIYVSWRWQCHEAFNDL